MSTGWGPTGGNAAINTLVGAYPWIKLHTGAPGSAGTANAALNTTRKSATFAAASGGSAATSAVLTWTSVPNAETYSAFTAWDASTAGTFGYSGTITANPVSAGDTFSIAIGAMTVALTLAS